ncbi:hypothetical protein CYLTODRAFT_421318 [Cylindrobasidium torrendii FP15055 ss-10]|uniref:BTB domain-containing protein n=1 Tax=Cylindrobasidium torrendii FP15055 ss-10 TaxID=1314674 RepID=A0A0D7BE64_9AGAR|nr:hypothetical protein CYLTODRAFT_421318 [Cylindrobasidium torrendii FP15055 ss-10]
MADQADIQASSDSDGTRIASAPFDTPDGADIALRTSDNTIFFFKKYFLIAASPFFSNLLSDATPGGTSQGRPICPVIEDSGTMHLILRLCSPSHITMEDFVAAISSHPVLSSLDKYIMTEAHQRVVNIFQEGAAALIQESPLQAFGIARALGEDTIARQAARQLLCIPMDKWTSSDKSTIINVVTGSDYHRLVQYFLRCGQAAHDTAKIAHSLYGTCARCKSPKPKTTWGLSDGEPEPNFSRLDDSNSGLRLGSSVIHIRKNTTLSYSDLVALQKITDSGDIYRHCPGTRELPQAVVSSICEMSMSACHKGVRGFVLVKSSIDSVLKAMYKEIDEAINKVPLELGDAM